MNALGDYDDTSRESIVSYAKQLINRTIRELCGNVSVKRGKGGFGQTLEKVFFCYSINSNSKPDFEHAGLELKSLGLVVRKSDGKEVFRAKERLVLNLINYMDEDWESFRRSTFWRKNAELLLVMYVYEKSPTVFLDFRIKLVDVWTPSEKDLEIIEEDWAKIARKVKAGKSHELSEGDTLYLGACTKGSKGKNLREQPYSNELAKQRAYSYKQSYMHSVVDELALRQKEQYIAMYPGRAVAKLGFEQYVVDKFKPHIGKNWDVLLDEFDINGNAKHSGALLTKAIFDIKPKDKMSELEEFQKAGIIVRTVKIERNGRPKESVSFKKFHFKDLIKTDWVDSDFYSYMTSRFFFVFYRRYDDEQFYLDKVKFWAMPAKDLEECERVYGQTQDLLKEGKIVRAITEKGKVRNYFPKSKDNRVAHVRPHARNADDVESLPVRDREFGFESVTKQAFWLNAIYIAEDVYRD